MNRFIITCHGWSGSNYVAHLLHSYPSIRCAHSSAAIFASDRSTLEGDNLKIRIPALRKGYLMRGNVSLQGRYDDLEAEIGSESSRGDPPRWLGTVHTYRLRDLPAQARRYAIPRDVYPVWNLVRHPLDLVVSGFGQFLDLFQIDINEYAWSLDRLVRTDGAIEIVEHAAEMAGKLPGDYRIICFSAACAVMGSLRLDLDAMELIRSDRSLPWDYRGQFRMEDIVNDASGMRTLIEAITNQTVPADAAAIQRSLAAGPINRHNHEAATTTLARWSQLEAWQRHLFTRFFNRFALRKSYEEFGYDFSFLDEGP